MFQRKNKQKDRKHHKTQNHALVFSFIFAFVAIFNVVPAYAAGVPAGMFEAIDVAFKWVRNILLVGAAVSIVSYAFSFFMISGGRDGEKKIANARKKCL